MRFIQKTILAIAVFISLQVKAFTPESGFWWDPNESGSGYAIEIQDNFLFVALYVYDSAGNPIWYTAAKHLEGNAFFDASLDYTYDGTCIDCNYTPPITIFGERGPITINFLTEITATIQFEGNIKNIERFNFLLGNENKRMLGEWQATIDLSSTGVDFPYNGDVLLFDLYDENSQIVEGCRPDNTIDGFCTNFAVNNHEIAATFDYQNNQMIIVVSDDANYFLAYYINLGLDQFDGVVELYPKNEGNNNIFYPVRGFRTASRSFIETGVGPSKQAKNTNKKVIGLNDKIKINHQSKKLSEFSKEEQVKILRRQTIAKTLINKIENSSR